PVTHRRPSRPPPWGAEASHVRRRAQASPRTADALADNARMQLRFSKMQGAGNDFVVVDGVTQRVDLSPAQLRALADRRFGIGADQILLVEPPPRADVDFRYRIFNADGGEVE